MIVKAMLVDLISVQTIVYETISEVYPKYYPKEVVDFFMHHHREENILKDINEGNVYLLAQDGLYVGTGTINGNEMNRVFVLPQCQGLGYGSQIMNFIEQQIGKVYTSASLHSSLASYKIYQRRGYMSIDYGEELVDAGRVLCYQVMEKALFVLPLFQPLNINGKIFVATNNSSNGEVSSNTCFRYHQSEDVVWAYYAGGAIQRGHLIGRFVESNKMEFSYQHINADRNTRMGKCISLIETLPDGRLRLHETWQWLDDDKSKGTSILEEVTGA